MTVAEKRIAQVSSVVFHPLIITTLGLMVIFYSGTSLSVVHSDVKKISVIVVFLFTGVFPGSSILMLYLTKAIGDLDLAGEKERNLVMFLSAVMLLFTFFIMRGIPQLSVVHKGFIFAQVAGLFIGLLLNRIMRPSIHMLGLGSVIAMMLLLVIFFSARIEYFFIIGLVGAGLTAAARIVLGIHNMKEVVAGFFAGFVTTLVTLVLFLA